VESASTHGSASCGKRFRKGEVIVTVKRVAKKIAKTRKARAIQFPEMLWCRASTETKDAVSKLAASTEPPSSASTYLRIIVEDHVKAHT
jgi:hypothetical protein